MELYERADELETIVSTLDNLIDDITDKEYIDMFNEIKFNAQDKLNEIEEEIYKIEQEEQEELEREYDRERL